MPQLDMFSWFNQVITTTIVMFIFYMFLILFFLPTTTAIVKGRNKLTQLRQVTISIIDLRINTYIKDSKEIFTNLLVNNCMPLFGYYNQVNNTQLSLNILRTCYNINNNNIEKVMLQAALVNLSTNRNNFKIQDKVLLNKEEVKTILAYAYKYSNRKTTYGSFKGVVRK